MLAFELVIWAARQLQVRLVMLLLRTEGMIKLDLINSFIALYAYNSMKKLD